MARFSSSSPRDQSAGWFRVGTYEVGTTVLIAGMAAFGFVLYAVDPAIIANLTFYSARLNVIGVDKKSATELIGVLGGEIWRIATWPFANSPSSVFSLFAIALFWFFGKSIEEEIGRLRMLRFLVALTLGIGLWGTLISLFRPVLFSVGGDANGIAMLELSMLVAFAIMRPTAQFFFGIPVPILAAAVVVIDVLRYLGNREAQLVLVLAGALGMTAVLLRSMGLGDSIPQVPGLPQPLARWVGGAPGASTRPTRRPVRRPTRSSGSLRSVPPPSRTAQRPEPGDQAEIDRLLDKISATGIDSLSPDEKRRLDQASKRMRGSN